ncbi:MAG: efflux RND transporter permease subunit, partial [Bacteroidaceae bacterium]|nr:efflux RND transporter permease subunit [Bacteroidaceae bacterium]
MKHSFSILLTMCILMIIGVALIPRLDISNKPRPRQGSTLYVNFWWNGASAKVIEQNVTSRIEGVCSSIKGVENVSSESHYGHGNVKVELKKNASISSVKFEIASQLRQLKDKFPKGVSYPQLSGGEVITSKSEKDQIKNILTYVVTGPMPDSEIADNMRQKLEQRLEKLEGVNHVNVQGGVGKYLQISYDAKTLSLYGLTASDLETAIRAYMGNNDIIGDVMHTDRYGDKSRISLFLHEKGTSLESMPIKTIDDKIVFLNNLATFETKEYEPNNYFRINGQSTVYVSVYAEENVNIVNVVNRVEDELEEAKSELKEFHFRKEYDRAEEEMTDFYTLITRSAMALAILLLFVYVSRRNVKYLSIVFLTLLVNILIGVICYYVFDIRLHPFSMAGITVSFGLIIDSTIVMVDHYSYHHDYKAFWGILGAMLTTIGSLIIIFWLPEWLKNDLYDFSCMIIINLAVAIFVSAVFAPALVCSLKYQSRQIGNVKNFRIAHGWNVFYRKYVNVAQHRIWRWPMIACIIGLFIFSLLGFVDNINSNAYKPKDKELILHIRASMPIGGTATELNSKVKELEAFLSKIKEIKSYETIIRGGMGYVKVRFKPEYMHTSIPYFVENKVISKVITIGGADWSTYGISQKGFSNSLNLQYRSNRIQIAGYDYDKLYRYAEDIYREMSNN